LSPGKLYSGIGVLKSLPIDLLKARNSSVTWAQITWRPPSFESVSQLPFRNHPVFNWVQQGCKGSPSTFLGPFCSIGAIIDNNQLDYPSTTSKKLLIFQKSVEKF
jgi:hypothetical protein